MKVTLKSDGLLQWPTNFRKLSKISIVMRLLESKNTLEIWKSPEPSLTFPLALRIYKIRMSFLITSLSDYWAIKIRSFCVLLSSFSHSYLFHKLNKQKQYKIFYFDAFKSFFKFDEQCSSNITELSLKTDPEKYVLKVVYHV